MQRLQLVYVEEHLEEMVNFHLILSKHCFTFLLVLIKKNSGVLFGKWRQLLDCHFFSGRHVMNDDKRKSSYFTAKFYPLISASCAVNSPPCSWGIVWLLHPFGMTFFLHNSTPYLHGLIGISPILILLSTRNAKCLGQLCSIFSLVPFGIGETSLVLRILPKSPLPLSRSKYFIILYSFLMLLVEF